MSDGNVSLGIGPQVLYPLGGPFVVVDLLGLEVSQHNDIEDAQEFMRTTYLETGAFAVVRAIDGHAMSYMAPAMLDVRRAEQKAQRAALAWREVKCARATAEGTA